MKPAKAKSSKPGGKAKPAPRARTSRASVAVAKKTAGSAASTTALYLYGITGAAAKVKTTACPGIDGNYGVKAIQAGGLKCWVSDVDRQQFVTQLESHMENLEWLATVGVNHQKTVEQLAAQTAIVPARFGAVFLTEDSLREDVQRRASGLSQTLERLQGTEEWGVKIFFAPTAPPAPSPVNSGREYLAQKAKAMSTGRSKTLPPEELEQFVQGLQKSSVSWVPGKTGQQNLVWSGSFLLKKGSREKFDLVLRNFASRWQSTHQIECTGPWPPYSFV